MFRAERGGFPVTWASHLALTDETGGRLPLRAARGDRAAGRPVAGGRRRTDGLRASPSRAWTSRGRRPPAPPRGRWPGAAARTTSAAAAQGAEVAGEPVAGGFGLDLSLRADQAAGAPRRRRLDRLRGGRRLVLLLAHRDDRDGHAYARRPDAGGGRATPGSTTSGATSSRSAAAAGTGSRSTSTTARTSRCRWSAPRTARYPLVYGTLVDADGTTRHLTRGVRRGRSPTWTSPTTGATYPAGWTIRLPGRGTGDRPHAHGRPSRSWTRGRRRASCTGRARRSSRRDATARPSAGRPTWS